ncbi:MAG: hypothetical protein IKM97_05025 [Clostridia bacterium]|nr:hypothetical protein [Clostridia bacterium]
MVINKVIEGISLKINEVFGEKYEIYDDNTEQGMNKPCFFINYLDGDESRQIGLENKSYLDTLHFDITGFEVDDDRKKLNDMADKLYDLEYISLQDKTLLRADSLKPRISDGVLHFFIDYRIFIDKTNNSQTLDKMENIQLNEEVRNNA